MLPSTIGGDVLRVSRSSKTAGGDVAFASVAIERLTGSSHCRCSPDRRDHQASLLELPHAGSRSPSRANGHRA
jgi:hypothetical protein